MSGALNVLLMKEEDILKLPGTQWGSTNLGFQAIYKRKRDGVSIMNLKETWPKLLQTAYAVVATENPTDEPVSYPLGILANKFAAAPRAPPTAGCSTPGTFTNLIQAAFW